MNRSLSHCHIQIYQALHLLRKISWHHDTWTSFAVLHNVNITFDHISVMLPTMLGSSFDEIKYLIGSWSFGGSFSSILDTFYEENHLPFVWLHFQCAAVICHLCDFTFNVQLCCCLSCFIVSACPSLVTYRVKSALSHVVLWSMVADLCIKIVKKNK